MFSDTVDIVYISSDAMTKYINQPQSKVVLTQNTFSSCYLLVIILLLIPSSPFSLIVLISLKLHGLVI